MKINPEINRAKTVDEILAMIEFQLGLVMATGAADEEPSALRKISEDLKSGAITPEKAESAVNKLLAAREDYH